MRRNRSKLKQLLSSSFSSMVSHSCTPLNSIGINNYTLAHKRLGKRENFLHWTCHTLYAYTKLIVYKMYKSNKRVDFKYKTSLPGLMICVFFSSFVRVNLSPMFKLPTIKKRLYPSSLLCSHTDLVEFVLLLLVFYFSSAFKFVIHFQVSISFRLWFYEVERF